jgi:hypothetical protein
MALVLRQQRYATMQTTKAEKEPGGAWPAQSQQQLKFSAALHRQRQPRALSKQRGERVSNPDSMQLLPWLCGWP